MVMTGAVCSANNIASKAITVISRALLGADTSHWKHGNNGGAAPENHALASHAVGQQADEGRGHETDGAQHHAGRQRGRGRQAQFLLA